MQRTLADESVRDPRGWTLPEASDCVSAALFVTAVLIPAAAHAETPGAAPAGGTQPSPRLVELIQREHHPKDWLFVTTPQGRLELRARTIDDAGLSKLEVRRGTTAPAEPLPWSSVTRIEMRESKFRAGQWIGLAAGALALGYVGGAIGEGASSSSESHNDAGAFTGIALGAVTGAWLGGKLGDRMVDSRLIYEAQPTPENAAAIEKARTSLKTDDMLRVRGRFGEFVGRARTIDAEGLSRLEPSATGTPTTIAAPEMLTWPEIVKIDRSGNSSRRYAITGAVLAGLGVGALAAAASSGFGNSDADVLGAFAVGAGVGALAGVGVGAWIGSGVPRWHQVYARVN